MSQPQALLHCPACYVIVDDQRAGAIDDTRNEARSAMVGSVDIEAAGAPVQSAPPRRRLSDKAILLWSLGLAGVIAVIDALTSYLNLPILFLVPLTLCARIARPRAMYGFVVLLVVLTYALLVYDVRVQMGQEWSELLSYRLLNRTLTAAAMVAAAVVLRYWRPWGAEVRRRQEHCGLLGPDELTYGAVIHAAEQASVTLFCVILIAVVAAADLLLPGQYNLPILYCVPILLTIWSHSRRLLWTLTVLLLLLAVLGYQFGEPPTVAERLTGFLLMNRTLAIVMMTGVAVFVHIWLSYAEGRRSGSRKPNGEDSFRRQL